MNIARLPASFIPTFIFTFAFAAVPVAAVAATACDMLTTAEVGKALGGSVVIDRNQSGPDDRGGDNCAWIGPNKAIVLVRIQPVAEKNMVQRTYQGSLEEAYANGKQPEPMPGVGDEAKFRHYAGNLKGGVIVGRKGQTIFVVEGSTGREALASLANSMLSRCKCP